MASFLGRLPALLTFVLLVSAVESAASSSACSDRLGIISGEQFIAMENLRELRRSRDEASAKRDELARQLAMTRGYSLEVFKVRPSAAEIETSSAVLNLMNMAGITAGGILAGALTLGTRAVPPEMLTLVAAGGPVLGMLTAAGLTMGFESIVSHSKALIARAKAIEEAERKYQAANEEFIAATEKLNAAERRFFLTGL